MYRCDVNHSSKETHRGKGYADGAASAYQEQNQGIVVLRVQPQRCSGYMLLQGFYIYAICFFPYQLSRVDNEVHVQAMLHIVILFTWLLVCTSPFTENMLQQLFHAMLQTIAHWTTLGLVLISIPCVFSPTARPQPAKTRRPAHESPRRRASRSGQQLASLIASCLTTVGHDPAKESLSNSTW